MERFTRRQFLTDTALQFPGVGVSDIRDAPRTVFTKLDIQPACCQTRRNLQHFDEKLLWLVMRDIPNCGCPLSRSLEAGSARFRKLAELPRLIARCEVFARPRFSR